MDAAYGNEWPAAQLIDELRTRLAEVERERSRDVACYDATIKSLDHLVGQHRDERDAAIRERNAEASINARWQEMNRNQVEQIRTLTRQVKVLREALEGMPAIDCCCEKGDEEPCGVCKAKEALAALTSEGDAQ